MLEWIVRNMLDGSLLHIMASTEDVLEVLKPASNDESLTMRGVMTIKTV